MRAQTKNISDQQVLSVIAENNPEALAHVYVHYAFGAYLFRHTHSFGKQQVKGRGITCSKDPIREIALINEKKRGKINYNSKNITQC